MIEDSASNSAEPPSPSLRSLDMVVLKEECDWNDVVSDSCKRIALTRDGGITNS